MADDYNISYSYQTGTGGLESALAKRHYWMEQTILEEFRGYAGEFAAVLEGWTAIRRAALNITNDMLDAGQLTP